MAIENRRNLALLSFLVAILLAGSFFWLYQGYGEVSPRTYQISKAIYSACLKKSHDHLAKVEELLNESDEASLPTNEAIWLDQIIKIARSGNWDSAAKKAKRMMEDQVKY